MRTQNRLIEARNFATTPGLDSRRIFFQYDYMGRRVEQRVESFSGQTWIEDSRTRYVYDDWNVIARFDATDSQTLTLERTYLCGIDLSGTLQGAGGVGGLLKEGDLYTLFDANGNIMQKLDSAGAVAANLAYDPFGNLVSGTLSDGDYGFSTKPLAARVSDGDGLYYYGFRYYSPEMGRWLNRDPIGEQGHAILKELDREDESSRCSSPTADEIEAFLQNLLIIISYSPNVSIEEQTILIEESIRQFEQWFEQSSCGNSEEENGSPIKLEPYYLFAANNAILNIDLFGLQIKQCGLLEDCIKACKRGTIQKILQ